MSKSKTALKFLILTGIFITIFTGSVHSQNWGALGTGTNNEIRSILSYNGELIVAGRFTLAGGNIVSRIARWNGSAWNGFGVDFNNAVLTMVVYNNELIAAGEFTTAGGVGANRIAKWNGSTWTPLGLGLNDDVYALAVYNNKLYAGGIFTSAGGVASNRIAAWTGSGWEAVGSGVNNDVNALIVFNNALYAGGEFTTAGGVTCNRVAKWDGVNWAALGVGMDNGEVHALSVHGGNLVVGGSFTQISNINVGRIARWNGTNWSVMGTGFNDRVRALWSNGSILYAGGIFTTANGNNASEVAAWNGAAWSAMGQGITSGNSEVYNITGYGGAAIIGGRFTNAGGVTVNNIGRYGAAPVAPVLISPVNNSQGQSLTPLIDWSDVPNTATYKLEVSLFPTFTPLVVSQTLIPSQFQVPANVLQLNNTYYWRVSATNIFGTGPFSPVWQFSSTLTGINNNSGEVPAEYMLYQNYPNPFNPSTGISFDLPKAGKVSLKVFNSSGKEVSELLNGDSPAGKHTVQFNAQGLSSGIYYYSIKAAEFTAVKRMVLVK